MQTQPHSFPPQTTDATGVAPRPRGLTPHAAHPSIQALQDEVARSSSWVAPLQQEIGRVIVGQTALVERLLVGLLAGGHLLLEGVPGLAKTLMLKTLAGTLQAGFQRLQFTPDMLPADIVGTLIYNPRDGGFVTKRGPVFTNLVLADEINRAPAKVQSALLEAMQERQVTLGDETYPLPDPFLVMATQNPLEHEGTFPLPEAQVDRFMMKLIVDYPNRAEERAIVDTMATSAPDLRVQPMATLPQILEARGVVNRVYVDDRVKDYVVDLVAATRKPEAYGLPIGPYVQYGASPRATINLTLAAKALAFLHGRAYVTPLDVKTLAPDILRHRVAVTYEAEAEGVRADDLVGRILETLPVP
jgi:MoxR-like ATPase